MDGRVPQSVTAVTRQLQPEANPDVDDEADVLLTYPSAVSVVQASWDWPFSIKEMDVYGRTGYAKSIDLDQLEVHKARQRVEPATRIPPGRAVRRPHALSRGRAERPDSGRERPVVAEDEPDRDGNLRSGRPLRPDGQGSDAAVGAVTRSASPPSEEAIQLFFVRCPDARPLAFSDNSNRPTSSGPQRPTG